MGKTIDERCLRIIEIKEINMHNGNRFGSSYSKNSCKRVQRVTQVYYVKNLKDLSPILNCFNHKRFAHTMSIHVSIIMYSLYCSELCK